MMKRNKKTRKKKRRIKAPPHPHPPHHPPDHLRNYEAGHTYGGLKILTIVVNQLLRDIVLMICEI